MPSGIDPATGKPLVLSFDLGDTSTRGSLRFQFFVNEWSRLGLDVEIAATTYNQFQEKVRKGAYQIFMWGWIADYPDPENFLFLLWGPLAHSKSHGSNTANFADPRYDALFARMKVAENGARAARDDPRDARDPRAGAALDRALPPRELHALPRLGAQREADRALAPDGPLRGRRLRAARASGARNGTSRCAGPPGRWRRSRSAVVAPGRRHLPAREAMMLAYVIRRSAYGFVTLLGVLLLLFLLFFLYATPEQMARRAVGEKAPPEALEQWIVNHGYDKPKVWNPEHPLDTLLVEHFRRTLTFDFGRSDADGTPILQRLREGSGPSLALAVPSFVLGLVFSVALGLFVAYFRETYIDRMGVVLCVLTMSVSTLLYIIGGQFLIGKLLRWFPISGFDPSPSVIVRFLMLPLLVEPRRRHRRQRALLSHGVHRGGQPRLRAHCPREGLRRPARDDASRAAQRPDPDPDARGGGDPLPLPGSLLLESFFGIPGLGSLTVDAINGNDFSTLRAMVFIGALFFIVAQIATDVSYTLVDPRVRLE